MRAMQSDGELELADYLDILKRRWLWFALGLVAVVSLAATLSLLQADRYRAQAAVALGSSAAQEALDPGAQSTSFLAREINNEINFAESDAVRQAVVDDIGVTPSVSITNESGTDVLVFTATASFASNAARDANAWANAYLEAKQSIAAESILGAVDELEDELRTLRSERETVRAPLDELETELAAATVVSRGDLERQIAALELEVAPDLEVIDAQIASTFDRTELTALRNERRRVLAPITDLQADLPLATEQSRAELQVQVDIARSRLAPELDLIDTRIETTVRSITELEQSSRFAADGTAQIVQTASEPSAPINAPLARNLVLGVVVGSILGLAAALLAETLDQTVHDASDVRTVTDVPVLGTIPEMDKGEKNAELSLATLVSPGSAIADAYHKVRSSLQFALVDGQHSSLLITSANESEGKTTSAVNLSWAMAGLGHRVALADVDFRRPRIHEVFGLPLSPGQSDHLLGTTPLADLVRHVDHPQHSMVVLPTGTLPPNPADFVGSQAFVSLIDDLAHESDMLVLDAPPVLPVSDAVTTARHVDGVILTVKLGSTTKEQLGQAVNTLQQGGANLIGIILVGSDDKQATYYYGPDKGGSRPLVSASDRSLIVATPVATAVHTNAPSAIDLGARSGAVAAATSAEAGEVAVAEVEDVDVGDAATFGDTTVADATVTNLSEARALHHGDSAPTTGVLRNGNGTHPSS